MSAPANPAWVHIRPNPSSLPIAIRTTVSGFRPPRRQARVLSATSTAAYLYHSTHTNTNSTTTTANNSPGAMATTDDSAEGGREMNVMVTRPAWSGGAGSPLHRAGYLSPNSYSHHSTISSHPRSLPPAQPHPLSQQHAAEDIRASTMLLSDMLLDPGVRTEGEEKGVGDSAPPGEAADQGASPSTTPTALRSPRPQHRSNLSILLARQHSNDGYPYQSPELAPSTTPVSTNITGTPPPPNRASVYDGLFAPSVSSGPPPPPPAPVPADSRANERTPLLHITSPTSYTPQKSLPTPLPLPIIPKLKPKPHLAHIAQGIKDALSKESLFRFLKISVGSIPAVLLGTLLNILDGVSYGMIIFPAAGVFADLGGMGVSMFFVTTVISQLTYTFGGSGFAGANGSMMIEVVPFFHIIATKIANDIGENNPQEIIATTLVAFALSSILTGLAFLLLGALRLGALLGFFPRHILVGCIGGVGAFLIETGLTVSTRISDDDFSYTWATLIFFLRPSNIALWLPSMGLAVLLRAITHRYHHQLIFPMFFLMIPVAFYIVVAAAQLDLGVLRRAGWLFDMGNSADRSWYEFYTYFDFGKVKMGPLWSTLPTQFALLFFNILHPPLNVPALAVSLIEDVDTNKELVAHGYSNLLAGIFGSVPNYLVYVNTLLFYRVGGGTRIAGFLLAVATILLLLVGTGPIAYIPVMLVGSLIFVLGFDLVKEALWDTRHRVTRTEYLTIASIIVVMTAWDFVVGVLFGSVISCFFFVVQNSQGRSIRAIYTGQTAMSTVRRPGAHRAYIREVSRQTTILRLHGFLFFGTITYVEEAIKNIVEDPAWERRPVRFLVIDLTLVGGVDMSSAEAFVRVQRLLAAKNIVLVFCGFAADSAIGKALQSVGVLGEDFVELFTTFNDAMEWTENAYLRAWFRSQKAVSSAAVALPGRQDADIDFNQSLPGSHRRSHLQEVGLRTMRGDTPNSPAVGESSEPYDTLVKTFSSYGDVDREKLQPLVPYLERREIPEGLVLWRQDEDSDGLYLIESGVLRASYKFADHIALVEESMVPGTLAGELSALTSLPRNATVVVERQAVLWKLSTASMRRMESDDPVLARTFVQFVMKAAKIDYDILLSALATRP